VRKLSETEIKLDVQIVIWGEGRETRGHQAFREVLIVRYAEALAIQKSPGPALGRKEFVASRVIHHPDHYFTTAGQTQRNAEDRKTVGEIGCPIERIDVPAVIRSRFLAATFFRHYGVVGEVASQPFHDQSFRSPIRLGHQVRAPLVCDLERLPEMLQEQAARLTRNLDCDI
jgi:hypothetical protein